MVIELKSSLNNEANVDYFRCLFICQSSRPNSSHWCLSFKYSSCQYKYFGNLDKILCHIFFLCKILMKQNFLFQSVTISRDVKAGEELYTYYGYKPG